MSKTKEEKAREYARAYCDSINPFGLNLIRRIRFNAHLAGQAIKDTEIAELKDAVRWRNVEEELPEDKHETFIDGKYVYTIDPFIVKTTNGRYTVSKRVKFIGSSWNWIGSANFSESVIAWLPIPQETNK